MIIIIMVLLFLAWMFRMFNKDRDEEKEFERVVKDRQDITERSFQQFDEIKNLYQDIVDTQEKHIYKLEETVITQAELIKQLDPDFEGSDEIIKMIKKDRERRENGL